MSEHKEPCGNSGCTGWVEGAPQKCALLGHHIVVAKQCDKYTPHPTQSIAVSELAFKNGLIDTLTGRLKEAEGLVRESLDCMCENEIPYSDYVKGLHQKIESFLRGNDDDNQD
jgi:hypothetical protein